MHQITECDTREDARFPYSRKTLRGFNLGLELMTTTALTDFGAADEAAVVVALDASAIETL